MNTVEIAALHREPDTKICMELRTVGKVFGKKIKTHMPETYIRSKYMRILFRYPDIPHLSKEMVKNYVRNAALFAGSECTVEMWFDTPAVAWSTFKAKFATCFTVNAITALGVAAVETIIEKCEFSEETTTGKWSKV